MVSNFSCFIEVVANITVLVALLLICLCLVICCRQCCSHLVRAMCPNSFIHVHHLTPGIKSMQGDPGEMLRDSTDGVLVSSWLITCVVLSPMLPLDILVWPHPEGSVESRCLLCSRI